MLAWLQEKERGRVMNIKEIARRAGVSSATISRVLNNSGYVKEETRQKVLRAVEEYNYVPSAIARSLSIQDSLSAVSYTHLDVYKRQAFYSGSE